MRELIKQAVAGDLYGSIDDTDGGRLLGEVAAVKTLAGLRWHIGCADGWYEVPAELGTPASTHDVWTC